MEALAEPWMGVAQLRRCGRLQLTKERQSYYSGFLVVSCIHGDGVHAECGGCRNLSEDCCLGGFAPVRCTERDGVCAENIFTKGSLHY